MFVLANTATETAYDSSLFPSAVTAVELREPQEEKNPQDGAVGSDVATQEKDSAEFTSRALEASAKSSQKDESSDQESSEDLSEDEQKQVNELKERDQEVRTHEQAHVAAGGQYVRGGVSYSYQNGPDGKRYAVGGSVDIDTTPVANDPDATIRKMQTVRSAALAPAEPSGQDRSVASQATQQMAKAQAEKAEQSKSSEEAPKDESSESNSISEQTSEEPVSVVPSQQQSLEKSQTAISAYGASNSVGTHIDFAA